MVLDNQDAKYLNKRDQAFQNHRGRTRKQRNANTVRVKVSMMHEEKRQENRHVEILKSDLPEPNEKKGCGMQEISKFGFPTDVSKNPQCNCFPRCMPAHMSTSNRTFSVVVVRMSEGGKSPPSQRSHHRKQDSSLQTCTLSSFFDVHFILWASMLIVLIA